MTGIDLNQVPTLREQILFGLVIMALLFLCSRLYSAPTKRISFAKSQLAALGLEKETLLHFSRVTPVLSREASGKSRVSGKGIKARMLRGEVRGVSPDVSTLLNDLTNPSFLGGLQIKNLSYKPSGVEEGYSKVGFSINLNGNYADVVRFLERLEGYPALFYLDTIDLQSAEGQAQELQVQLEGFHFHRIEGG